MSRTSAPTILQIIPRLDTGGAELSTIEITEAVVRAGGRMLVATEGGRMADQVTRHGGTLVILAAGSKNPARMLANAARLRSLARSEGVDLLHARSRAPAWSALLAARASGLPLVTTYHGAYGERGRLKRLYNSVMARADIVIANSRFTADLIRQRYGTPEERIRVIYRGIEPARFDIGAETQRRAAELRQAWGIREGAPIVLQAARLTGWKGQMVVVEAAGRLAREGRLGPAIVVLAGDDQGRTGYRQLLEQRIAELGLGDRVRLVGHVEDIAAAYLAAHVTVVASTEPEAFGRAALEAEAMACPVIATAIGAPPETVIDRARVGPAGGTGWLVPPGDAQALADRLSEALDLDADERATMGTRARTHALAGFTLETMKRQTLEVYDTLLGCTLAARLAQR